jgi:hypothetical protein
MNVDVREEEKLWVEGVVSYSNIEITHVNDNATPARVVALKAVIWLATAALIAALFII